jgi:hypothetical protein
MKRKFKNFLIGVILINLTISVTFMPKPPTDQPIYLDKGPGSQNPNIINLEDGTFLTTFSTNTNLMRNLYYSRGISNDAILIPITGSTNEYVFEISNNDAAMIYSTEVNQAVTIYIAIFTKNPIINKKLFDFQGSAAQARGLYVGNNNIIITWNERTDLYASILILGTTIIAGSKIPLNDKAVCTVSCMGTMLKRSNGKLALFYRDMVDSVAYTDKIVYLNSDLTTDVMLLTIVSTKNYIQCVICAASRKDGSVIAVLGFDGTNLMVSFYNSTNGMIISPGPCKFNVHDTQSVSASIVESSAAGLFIVSVSDNMNKGYIILVDSTCKAILPQGPDFLINSQTDVLETSTSIAAIPGSKTSAFQVVYVESQTADMNITRIRTITYSMVNECVDVSIFIQMKQNNPLGTLSNVSSNISIVTPTTVGILTTNGIEISSTNGLNTVLLKSTLAYTANEKATTDSFTFKNSSYDFPCTAKITICSPFCKVCNAFPVNNSMGCTTCLDNYLFAENTSNCYSKSALVSDYYLSDNIFKTCYKSCLSCSASAIDELNQNCITCKPGYLPAVDSSKLCFEPTDTPKYYYYDALTSLFNKCFTTCQTCMTGGDDKSHNCQTCLPNFAPLKDLQGMCFDKTNTVSGYSYDPGTNTFAKCYSTCKTCSGLGSDTQHNCLSCKDGYSNTEDHIANCYSSSTGLNGYFYDDSAHMFRKCYFTCDTCTSFGTSTNNQCKTCTKGYYFKSTDPTNCFEGTLTFPGFYFDNSSSLYKPCFNTCETCNKGGDIYQPNCLTCKIGQTCEPCNGLTYEGNCISSCPDRTYIDSDKRICIKCSQDDPHCCSTVLYQNKCYQTCPEDTFLDEAGKSCYQCSERNKFLYKGSCLEKCPKGIILGSKCIVCADSGQYLYDNKCVDGCPVSTTTIDNICESTIVVGSN